MWTTLWSSVAGLLTHVLLSLPSTQTQSQLDEEEDGPDLGEEEEVEVLTGEEEDELDSIAAALSS